MGYYYTKTTYVSQVGAAANLFRIYDALVAAGWTIDTYTAGSRLHAHFGTEHISIGSYDAYRLQAYYCTGYNGGAGVGAQPGTSPAVYFTWALLSAGDYLTLQIQDSQIILTGRGYNTNWCCSFFYGIITQKIGSWNGGRLLVGDNQTASSPLGSGPGSGYLYLEGAWVSGLYGTHVNAHYLYCRPLSFSGASFLCPIMMCKNNTVDSSLKHPIGYISGLYQAAPSYFYEDADTILIGEDTYRWILVNGQWWLLAKAA